MEQGTPSAIELISVWPPAATARSAPPQAIQVTCVMRPRAIFSVPLQTNQVADRFYDQQFVLRATSPAGVTTQQVTQLTCFPSFVLSSRTADDEEIVVQFREELLLDAAGVYMLSVQAAHSSHDGITTSSSHLPASPHSGHLPYMVWPTHQATSEFTGLFDRLQLVGAGNHRAAVVLHQLLLSHQPASCIQATGAANSTALSAASHGLYWPSHVAQLLNSGVPLEELFKATSAELQTATSSGQAVSEVCWIRDYHSVMRDLEALLTFSSSICSTAALLSGSSNLTRPTSSIIPTGSPVQYAEWMLAGAVEFLGINGCWCCVSFLMAETCRNGLLAMVSPEGLRLHLRFPGNAAAATASTLAATAAAAATVTASAHLHRVENAESIRTPVMMLTKPHHLRNRNNIVNTNSSTQQSNSGQSGGSSQVTATWLEEAKLCCVMQPGDPERVCRQLSGTQLAALAVVQLLLLAVAAVCFAVAWASSASGPSSCTVDGSM